MLIGWSVGAAIALRLAAASKYRYAVVGVIAISPVVDWTRAIESWFAVRGVTVKRVLSDNGSAYRSFAWCDTCTELGITHKRTRPYRPQTSGKIEWFLRTLADGWACSRRYSIESARRAALPVWLHVPNQHRLHSIGSHPSISRLTNLPGQHN